MPIPSLKPKPPVTLHTIVHVVYRGLRSERVLILNAVRADEQESKRPA